MDKPKYLGTLITVSDLAKSRQFYEEVLEQQVINLSAEYSDEMIEFAGGLTLYQAESYATLVAGQYALEPTGVKLSRKSRPDNFQLYFEVEDLDRWAARVKATDGIELLHDVVEFAWGQRAMRFYDFDKYIVEIAESIPMVARRFLQQGLTVEQIAERFGDSVETVKNLLGTE